MAMNDFNIGFLAGLDGTKSKAKLNQDIDAIKKSLKELELKAKLDPNQVKALENQLNSLKVNLNNVSIDKTSLNNLVSQINNSLSGIRLQIPNLNTGNVGNQAHQVGQQIGQNISQGIGQSLLRDKSTVKFEEYFKQSGNAAKEAQQYFQNLLQSENATVAVLERFDDSKLNSFTVNVKRASGEVESLHYQLRNLGDNDNPDMWFKFTGGNTNDASAIKQIKDIENAFSDYTAKLSQFKSTNSEILSGLTTPLSDFETKLAGLKNGTSTIDEVANAYKSLNAEASNITKNFSRQLSPIDSAIRNLAKGEETISGLRAEFKGLNNAPKEINTELNKCTRLLENVKKIESQEGRTENWSQAYRQWSDSVDTLQAKLKTLRKEQSNIASTQIFNTSDLKNNNIAYMSKVYNTIEKQMVEINRLAKAKDWQIVDVSGVEEADGKIKKLILTVRDAEGALKKLDMQREKLQGNGKAQYGLMQVGDVKVLETASQAQEKLAQSTEKANTKLAEQADKIQRSTDVTKLTTDYQKFGVVSQEVENNLKELKLAQEAVVNAKGTDKLATEIDKYNTKLTETKSSLKELTTTQVSMNQRTSQMTSMQEWMRKNKAATKLVGDQVNKLIEECKTCDAVRFNGIKNEFKELQVQAGKAGKLGNSLFGSLKDQVSKFVQWVSVARTTMAIGNALRNGIISIKELDTALVDLKKTTDATASELEDFYYSANDTAKQLGVSTEEVINATSAWSRLGYAIKDASTMAENSAILASISPEMNIEEATDGLVSVLKAFKIEAEDSLDGVISKINIIGNTQAVDNNDIVDILTRSSSAMAEANNTLEETIALGTAATEITRDADAVGTMLKTVSMRIRGYDEELESYTDDLANLSGTIADLTKTTSTPGGISLFTDETKTTYKSTYQILKDISDIYDELDDKTQAQLLEALAGKRQGQAVAAIINNFDAAESSMNSMANSAGNAMKEMEIIYDSLDYKLNQTQETATGIAQNLFGREDMKLVVDTFNVFLGLLDKATEKLGLFGTVATGAGIFAGFKNVGRLKMQSLIVLNCRQ